MRIFLTIFTLCFTTMVFSNHNIDPGNIQLVLSRNNRLLKQCNQGEKEWQSVYHSLGSGNNDRILYGIEKIYNCLPAGGIKAISSSFQGFNDQLTRKRAVQAIGNFKTPEAEIELKNLLLANLSDSSFADIIDELKFINQFKDNGSPVAYRPVSGNVISLFISFAESKSLTDNQRGAVILAMGDLKDSRFRPVIIHLRRDNREFIRNLASLIYEMNFSNTD